MEICQFGHMFVIVASTHPSLAVLLGIITIAKLLSMFPKQHSSLSHTPDRLRASTRSCLVHDGITKRGDDNPISSFGCTIASMNQSFQAFAASHVPDSLEGHWLF